MAEILRPSLILLWRLAALSAEKRQRLPEAVRIVTLPHRLPLFAPPLALQDRVGPAGHAEGFATISFNCAAPCSSRRRHAAACTISRHWHGYLPQRGRAPNPCCRARAHGERRAAPGRPGWAHTSLAFADMRRAPSHPTSFRSPRDPVASSRAPASERQEQPFAHRARHLRHASRQGSLDPEPIARGIAPL